MFQWRVSAAKDRLETQIALTHERMADLQDRVRRALLAGRDDLARLALQRRELAVALLRGLEDQWGELEGEEERLAIVEQRLAAQIGAYAVRRQLLAARHSAAEAQVRIGEALSGVSDELAAVGRALARAEERAVRLQTRAAAIDRLVDEGVLDPPSQSPETRSSARLNNWRSTDPSRSNSSLCAENLLSTRSGSVRARRSTEPRRNGPTTGAQARSRLLARARRSAGSSPSASDRRRGRRSSGSVAGSPAEAVPPCPHRHPNADHSALDRTRAG